jgi:UDP-2,3-diacylglucosamine pyrophosphatase LpxH
VAAQNADDDGDDHGAAPADLYVVSDLHLGRGVSATTRRFASLEAFFYDDDFRSFCEFLLREAEERQRPFKLIINGDAFDLLRVELPDKGGARSEAYGEILTPARAGILIGDILRGHPEVVEGMASVLAAGHELVFLPGNHDVELQWRSVQDPIREALRERLEARGVDVDEAISRLDFRPWFYFEEGRVWLEHGCQYDPENAFRYPLRSGLDDEADAVHLAEQDLPLGNFVQRYLYNHFGHITFIVPTARANSRYLRFLLINQPRLLFKVLFSHLPFLVQLVRRAAGLAELTARTRVKETHVAELDELVATTAPGEKLREVDALKETGSHALLALRALGVQLAKGLGLMVAIGLALVGLWFLGFSAIQELGSFTIKTLLFLLLNFIGLMAALGALVYTLLRDPPPRPTPLRHAASRISKLLDVPIVSFGHTHDEVVWPVDARGGWYFNTGTWIAVFTHDVLIPRERVQYTFLRVRDQEGELLFWSPGRERAVPVVLLEERTPWLLPEPREALAS